MCLIVLMLTENPRLVILALSCNNHTAACASRKRLRRFKTSHPGSNQKRFWTTKASADSVSLIKAKPQTETELTQRL
jgi:hypothetical protein